MYNYKFNFYKPGIKNFQKKEILKLVEMLKSFGFSTVKGDFSSYPPTDKNGNFIFKNIETELSFNINDDYNKNDWAFSLSLDLEILEEENSLIASLSVPQEQIDFEPNSDECASTKHINYGFQTLYRAATAICFALEPYFAWCSFEPNIANAEQNLSFDKVSTLVWLNLFSFEFVKHLGGLNKVLLFPHTEVEKMYEESKKTGKYMFVPLQLSENPMEPIPEKIEERYKQKFPGVIFG